MAYFMIFCSLALVFGSWMWLMPSVQQKALASLRQRAIEAGFRAKFVSVENYQQQFGEDLLKTQAAPKTQIVRYTWHGDAPNAKALEVKLVFSESQVLIAEEFSPNSLSEADRQSLEHIGCALAEQLKGLLALEIKDKSGKRLLNLYWLEQGELDEVSFQNDLVISLQRW